MPLPSPTLDNRSYDQLVAEGRGLIPRLCPAWTDHNASDPGVTLVELAAWLVEQGIYRFDRPSAETLRAFARLVGADARPPAVAATVATVVNANAGGVALPPRIQLAAAGEARFESTAALFASSAALMTIPTEAFAPFGDRPRRGSTLYLGFDRALDAPGATLSLHVWTGTWQDDAATRDALIDEYLGMLERMREDCSCEAWKAATARADWHRHYRVVTLWEYHAGGGAWLPLRDVVDETRALSLTGFVRFTAPVNHQPGGPGPLHYLRCRIVSGRFECPPRLLRIAFNAVPCEHAVTRVPKRLATARGHAHSLFAVGEAPIVAGTVRVTLDDGAGDVQTDWDECLEWDRVGAHERHYRVVPERGEIVCGDGLRGVPFPAGYGVFASWRAGGGAAGNIAAGTLDALPASGANVALAPGLALLAVPLTVDQPFAARGGRARDTLRTMQARALEIVTRVDKAVTSTDFERLARATPGVPVARVHAVAGLYPGLPCYPAPGSIAVIVVPRCALPAPRPSAAMLEAVRRYLEPRRLTTSEVHVIAPCYRRVAVSATLHLACDVDAEATVTRARSSVDAFLDPLTGGPDGSGWPIGRTVYRSEMLALLANLDGVTHVTALGLRGRGDREPRCDNVELCPHELVVPGRHRLATVSALPRNLARSDPHECQPC